MDVAHGVGPAEIEQVVIAAHLAVPGVEARAAIAFLVELERLDHGAHGAVEHQDAFLHLVDEGGAGSGVGRGHRQLRFRQRRQRAAAGPSRWQMA